MWELFSDPDTAVFLVPIVAVVGYFWYEVSKVRSNNELKRKMIDRGMSVEEIERVLGAGGETEDRGQMTEDGGLPST